MPKQASTSRRLRKAAGVVEEPILNVDTFDLSEKDLDDAFAPDLDETPAPKRRKLSQPPKRAIVAEEPADEPPANRKKRKSSSAAPKSKRRATAGAAIGSEVFSFAIDDSDEFEGAEFDAADEKPNGLGLDNLYAGFLGDQVCC